MLLEKTRQYIASLSNPDLAEYLRQGVAMYDPDAVEYATQELTIRRLRGEVLEPFDGDIEVERMAPTDDGAAWCDVAAPTLPAYPRIAWGIFGIIWGSLALLMNVGMLKPTMALFHQSVARWSAPAPIPEIEPFRPCDGEYVGERGLPATDRTLIIDRIRVLTGVQDFDLVRHFHSALSEIGRTFMGDPVSPLTPEQVAASLRYYRTGERWGIWGPNGSLRYTSLGTVEYDARTSTVRLTAYHDMIEGFGGGCRPSAAAVDEVLQSLRRQYADTLTPQQSGVLAGIIRTFESGYSIKGHGTTDRPEQYRMTNRIASIRTVGRATVEVSGPSLHYWITPKGRKTIPSTYTDADTGLPPPEPPRRLPGVSRIAASLLVGEAAISVLLAGLLIAAALMGIDGSPNAHRLYRLWGWSRLAATCVFAIAGPWAILTMTRADVSISRWSYPSRAFQHAELILFVVLSAIPPAVALLRIPSGVAKDPPPLPAMP